MEFCASTLTRSRRANRPRMSAMSGSFERVPLARITATGNKAQRLINPVAAELCRLLRSLVFGKAAPGRQLVPASVFGLRVS